MYEHDPLTHRVIGCAIEVHRHLGPGLLEATHERALSSNSRKQTSLTRAKCPCPFSIKDTLSVNTDRPAQSGAVNRIRRSQVSHVQSMPWSTIAIE